MSDPVPANDDDAKNRNDNVDDLALQHRQAEAQSQAIAEQTRSVPLTGTKTPISTLLSEYTNNPNFVAQLKSLSFTQYRPIRGDGNCYYRAFLYSLVELSINHDDRKKSITEYFKVTSWNQVKAAGFSEMALEIFYDAMVDLLEHQITDMETFHTVMNQENDVSDYCTWYMRAITAAYLKTNAERFLPFCYEFDCHDINTFCAKHVEPMGQECEQVQVLALAEATGIGVQISYVDGRSQDLQTHSFGPSDASVKLNLLYRPGHYDILYT